MPRTWKIVIAVAVVLVALVIAGQVSARDRKIPRVTTAKAAVEEMVSKVTANGKIQAEKKVELSALVMGQIVNLAVRDGDSVKKGDFLLQIDRNRAVAEEAGSAAALAGSLAALDSAQATLAQARREEERAKRNYEAKILPEADQQKAKAALETAEADYQVAQRRVEQNRANLNASRDTLSKTTVRAPIDGVVTNLPVKEGEVTVIGTMNNPGTQLMTISDMSTVEAVLMVDETDVPTVQVGQKAILSIEAYPNRAFEGLVTQVENSPISKTDPELQGLITTSDAINFKVRVKLLRPPERIRPGFSVSADVITGSKPKALAVPLAAIIVRDSPKGEKTATGRIKTESGVYVLKDGKARFLPVELGLAGELKVEVTGGLSDGQEIITGPFKTIRTLKEGDRVKIEKEKKGAEASGSAS
ncbi:MAG TPA: efflux RND transporter periplasmic adaptor subunit [Thermoanaerobaculia bacterium]|nr:efflux RND transporter periplasmic adaptor subunit [Thermoanaerobaculia bacterium]